MKFSRIKEKIKRNVFSSGNMKRAKGTSNTGKSIVGYKSFLYQPLLPRSNIPHPYPY